MYQARKVYAAMIEHVDIEDTLAPTEIPSIYFPHDFCFQGFSVTTHVLNRF